MRAIRVHEFGEPEVLKVEEIDDLQPQAGQILVRVQAIGVNPVDTYIRSGKYPTLPSLPYTPGTDAAGIVEAVGDGVTEFVVGHRVYTFGSLTGTYAETVLCEPLQLHPLPRTSAFAEGAAMGVACATAWRALFQKGSAKPGETVLIHGATGGVGSTAVQLAHAAGLRVVGTGGTEVGRQRARTLGAHLVLDHHDAGYMDEALAFTRGRGFDLIIELLANVNLGRDLTVLAPRGRVVVVGSRGSVEIDPRNGMGRDAAIHFMSLFNASQEDLASIHAALFAALETGVLKPVIDKQLPLARAPEAHRDVLDAGAQGKIILLA